MHTTAVISAGLVAAAALPALRRVVRRRARCERLLIVGAGPMAERIAEEVYARPSARWRLVGLVDDPAAEGGEYFEDDAVAAGPWLGRINRLPAIIEETAPSRIVIAWMGGRHRMPPALIDARMRGIPVETAVSFYERLTGKLAIETLTPGSIVLCDGFRHSDFVRSDVSSWVTRTVNLLTAGAGLLLLAPLFSLIAAAIALESPGGVFFVQRRVGRAGEPFGLIKFRTMRSGGRGGSEWERDNVHRITRVGRWLRRFRIDELPQLLNVLRGEMNLVGPRPHPVSNHALFLAHIPYYPLRAVVRPGITGWAQIRYGYANGLEEETEKMRYDLYYIKHRSLWLDLRILAGTLGVVAAEHRVVAAHHPQAPRAPQVHAR